MSSSSDFAPGSEDSPADGSDPSGSEENDAVLADDSLADLHRETSAMLRTLADRYEADSADKRATVARLRTEMEAAESLATQLAEESARVRADADRMGTPPEWIDGPTKGEGASGQPAGTEAATEAGTASETGTDSEAGTVSETGTGSPEGSESAAPDEPAVPGPGPARGFAEGEPRAESTDSTSASQSAAPEDWAPRPFESWRNQTSRMIPRLLGL
jgi:hypothetical protein